MNPPNLNYSLISSNIHGWYAIYDATSRASTPFASLEEVIDDVIALGKRSFSTPGTRTRACYPLTDDISEITLPFVQRKYPELFV